MFDSMHDAAIALARAATEPAPCQDCRFRERCSSEQLACDKFAVYLGGATRERSALAPRVPSRVRYEALFGARHVSAG